MYRRQLNVDTRTTITFEKLISNVKSKAFSAVMNHNYFFFKFVVTYFSYYY